MSADPSPATTTPRTTRALVMTWVRRVLVVVVLAGAVYQLVVQWPEVSKTLASLPVPTVVLSFLAVLAATCLQPLMWRIMLADLDTRIRARDASMIYLVGQLGKYVPGSVWAFLVQMELAKAAGVTRVRSFTASLIVTGVGIVSSLAAGVLAMPVILDGHRELLWLFLVLPFGLALLHPRLLTWLISRVLRVLRRAPLPHPLSFAPILKIFGLAVVVATLYGLHLWLLADALGSPGWSTLLLCVGTMSLAMTAGLLAFFLPSGIGVREVVIVAALATVLPTSQALALAVVSRVMFTVVDLASAGGAALIARHGRTRPAAEEPSVNPTSASTGS